MKTLLIVWATRAFADGGAPALPPPPQPGILGMLLPFGLMALVFYFLMIRPQQKKLKEHEEMVGGLQKGEEVVTKAGIFGKVHGIADKFITLEIDHNVRIKVLKTSVELVLRGEQKAQG